MGLVNTVEVLVYLRALTVLLESILVVVLLLVCHVPQAKFQVLALVCALDANLANTTLCKVLIRVEIALKESFRRARILRVVRSVRVESILQRLLLNALHALLANTVLGQQVPVCIVMSVNMLLLQARRFALNARWGSLLEIFFHSSVVIVPWVSMREPGLNIATAVLREHIRQQLEVPRVPCALQPTLQLAAVLRYVSNVVLARLSINLVLLAATHVLPESTLETTILVKIAVLVHTPHTERMDAISAKQGSTRMNLVKVRALYARLALILWQVQ